MIEDIAVGRPKTPAEYIQEAKEKYQKRSSFYGSQNSSPPRTASRARRRRVQSQEMSVRQEEKDREIGIIPEWIRDRTGFGEYYQRKKVARLADIESICRKNASTRSEAEKVSLRQWASQYKALAEQPVELLDRLQALVFAEPFKLPESYVIVLRGRMQYLQSEAWKSIDTGGSSEGFSDIAGKPVGECAVLRVKKTDVDQVNMSVYAKQQRICLEFLSEAVYFRLFPPLKLQRLSRAAEKLTFSAGEVVYKEGSASSAFYIVKEGEVAVQLPVNVGQGYRWPIGRHAWEVNKLDMVYNLTLKRCPAGVFFGESELAPYRKRSTLAKALVPSVCYVVSREKFLEVFTSKEVADICLYGNLTIPSDSESVHLVLKHVHAHRDHQRVLEQCSSADHSFSEVRDTLLDPPTKKLKTWIQSLRCRGRQAGQLVKQDIVKLHKDRVVVRSADLLHLAEFGS